MTRREEGNKDFLRAIDNSVYLERETRVVCVWFGWTGKGGRLLLGPSSLRTREFLSRAGVMVCVCGESGSGAGTRTEGNKKSSGVSVVEIGAES